MCTSMLFKTKDSYFGRNMDLDYHFNEKIIITPRNYALKFKNTNKLNYHIAMIGTATIIDNFPLYADATNEFGLSVAGLYFSDNSQYSTKLEDNKYNIISSEVITWILANCKNIEESIALLHKTNIVGLAFNNEVSSSSLHWHIADINRSIVLEYTKDGIKIYDNPINILTNNPEFSFHMTNLAMYLNLETNVPKNIFSKKLNIEPFCKGIGSVGLPGDYSSPSRFVKAAYLKLNSACNDDENSSISQFFHILDNVSVVNGCVMTEKDNNYRTNYSCCMNLNKGIYYYKTYDNNRITAINLWNENIDGDRLIIFDILTTQSILYVN